MIQGDAHNDTLSLSSGFGGSQFDLLDAAHSNPLSSLNGVLASGAALGPTSAFSNNLAIFNSNLPSHHNLDMLTMGGNSGNSNYDYGMSSFFQQFKQQQLLSFNAFDVDLNEYDTSSIIKRLFTNPSS